MKREKPERIAVSVEDASSISGLGKTKLYELISNQEVKSMKIGRRRLIDYASLKARLTSEKPNE